MNANEKRLELIAAGEAALQRRLGSFRDHLVQQQQGAHFCACAGHRSRLRDIGHVLLGEEVES